MSDNDKTNDNPEYARVDALDVELIAYSDAIATANNLKRVESENKRLRRALERIQQMPVTAVNIGTKEFIANILNREG